MAQPDPSATTAAAARMAADTRVETMSPSPEEFAFAANLRSPWRLAHTRRDVSPLRDPYVIGTSIWVLKPGRSCIRSYHRRRLGRSAPAAPKGDPPHIAVPPTVSSR